MEDIYR